jgi:hypothetical protein
MEAFYNLSTFLFSGEKNQYKKCIPWIAERKENGWLSLENEVIVG